MPQERRVYIMCEEIDDLNQQRICQEIEVLSRESDLPIILCIDSSGGKVILEEKIIRTIKSAGAPVHGLVTGKAFSAAFDILQACKLRFAYRSAQFMFHAPRISAETISAITLFPADFDFVAEDAEEYVQFLQLLADRSDQPLALLRQWGREERIFTALEAKELGFIDAIIAP